MQGAFVTEKLVFAQALEMVVVQLPIAPVFEAIADNPNAMIQPNVMISAIVMRFFISNLFTNNSRELSSV